jgi:hypothetical protein
VVAGDYPFRNASSVHPPILPRRRDRPELTGHVGGAQVLGSNVKLTVSSEGSGGVVVGFGQIPDAMVPVIALDVEE